MDKERRVHEVYKPHYYKAGGVWHCHYFGRYLRAFTFQGVIGKFNDRAAGASWHG